MFFTKVAYLEKNYWRKIAGIGTDRFDVSSEQAAYCRFAFIFIDFY